LLAAIANDPLHARTVGFKPSGGIRTVADAAVYIALCEEYLGPTALTAQRFRIGASSVLNDIESVLGNTAVPAPAGAGTY
jgi:deoxyribose-phosphate aldolase